MGYVIMTFSSARMSERRARIIYIWMHLSFPTFFSLFRLQKKAAILIKNPSPFFLFFFCFHIGRTLQLEQYIKSIKQSLSFYCVFLTTLHISPQFPAYNFVVLFFSTSSS
ncbi:APG_G0033300.mRNA.1.CDS.1 [Saccharomyces cerevisiae]|nr:APG_G0033300.mRNA.1.CDS.1 [Saccharomyces cerevisiae]CAI4616953.1 CRL_G0034960.mRNA.1.CDS.1 [Saccharomyces cerevisiae]CAI7207190.1 APG_G0033300.mRNA.1.CDS.1 [Saccharomyces cerevisiae]CAI7399617.1 CRL_G0034960.mRNA.1.CDS.1 [Saccharomyces cerevisiae]